MSQHNYEAGVQMTMATVVRNYLRWFELHQCKRTIAKGNVGRRRKWLPSWAARLNRSPADYTLDADLMPDNHDAAAFDVMDGSEIISEDGTETPSSRKPLAKGRSAIKQPENDGFADAS
jgi:hypothetical protein